MFYSHTHLARKGPLGTVWSAAHLQNRLKKSHYTATNIPKTVDLILFSALRLSGHLLLGVAPVESVTLPQALNLDDFDLEEDDTLQGEFDNHLRSQQDITLTDQIPTGIDPYVAVTFDEVRFLLEFMTLNQSTEPVRAHHPGDTDVEMAYETEPNNDQADFNIGLDTGTYGSLNDTEEIPEFQDPRPINLTEPINLSPGRSNANSPGSVPEVEIRRDAVHGLSPASHPPFAAEQHNVGVESTLDETLNGKEPNIPNIDEQTDTRIMVPDGHGHSNFELRSGSPGFAGSEEEHENFVHPSPQLVLQPTPLPPQPQVRPRKRKHFDKVTVLTNRIMRERLEDPIFGFHHTLRKRKKMPSSKLSVWRMNNQSKKEQIFNEPLLTGSSDVLRSVFDKDCVASKTYLAAVSDETIPEAAPVSSPTNQDSTVHLSPVRQTEHVQDSAGPQSTPAESVAREAQSPPPFNNDDTGIERLRDGGYTEYMPSPPPRFSSSRTDDFATQPGASAIPEMVDEELYFLEVGGNTPASQDSGALTGRTRALGQYLKERSSNTTPTSSHSSGDLSLGKILAGKTRKLAARMFFETLVLKSRGLIDMQQDQPYGDITLKLMPGLFSEVQP
uniref:Rad21/Rec8-like protein C-terminal eukaryotic domain-containing protein n=1 Tax=Brassica oleracea TaxID=3712 RepID=A0A3P6BTL7_BRAOL|nr:unnamed protein product [Brassica oleracea]